MAITTVNKCLGCGARFSAINDLHGRTCGSCAKANAARRQFGEGEQADLLFALCCPREYEQEQIQLRYRETMFGGTP